MKPRRQGSRKKHPISKAKSRGRKLTTDHRIGQLIASIHAQVQELHSLVQPTETEMEAIYESDYDLHDDAETLNEAILTLQYRDKMVRKK